MQMRLLTACLNFDILLSLTKKCCFVKARVEFGALASEVTIDLIVRCSAERVFD